MRKRLLIAAELDRSFVERIEEDARFSVSKHVAYAADDLARVIGDAEVLVTRAHNQVTRRVIEAAPRLELIAQGTSGTDNIDESFARARGITVISLPGENANAVAELVIGNIIALTRTVPAYSRQVAAGAWQRDDCAARHELRHFRLGIIGLGQVGRRVARLAAVFRMRVAAFDPYIEDADFHERGAARAHPLEELLASSDVLTLHVPHTKETRRMISAPQLAALPRGAIVVNASRGEVLDLDAALRALADDHLSGLALDVFDPEPPGRPFPDDPRLIVTPHVAGCSFESKASIGAKLYEKIATFYLSPRP